MATERSEFEKIKSVILGLNGKGSKVFLKWDFLKDQPYGERLSGYGYYNSDIDAIFVNYKSDKGGSGTFVLDKDTLATNIEYIPEEKKDGTEIK